MNTQIFKNIRLVVIGIVIAVGLSYVHASASQWIVAPATPPSNNAMFPVNIAAKAQLKLGGLAVGSFVANQSAQFEKQLYLNGVVRGGTPADASSTVYFGDPAANPGYKVDGEITGNLAAIRTLRSGILANSSNSYVCADAGGKLVLCGVSVQPTVSLVANPYSGTVGMSSTLSVVASNFNSLTSCVINHGVGTVTNMTQNPAGSTTWTGSIRSGSITTSTNFTVTCSGTTAGNASIATDNAYVTVGAASSGGYYAHCFIGGTQVTMADGSKKNIQDVKIGDRLKGESTTNTVLGFHRPELGGDKLYGFNGSTAFVTAEHPFMTTKGWKSIDPVKTRKENIGVTVTPLVVGDTLVTDKGLVKITSIKSNAAPATTPLYNFLLDGDHTYFADGYLVHNKELCNNVYPACSSSNVCIDANGNAISNGASGSCSVSCIPGQPVQGGAGICSHGGTLTCSPQGQKMCI